MLEVTKSPLLLTLGSLDKPFSIVWNVGRLCLAFSLLHKIKNIFLKSNEIQVEFCGCNFSCYNWVGQCRDFMFIQWLFRTYGIYIVCLEKKGQKTCRTARQRFMKSENVVCKFLCGTSHLLDEAQYVHLSSVTYSSLLISWGRTVLNGKWSDRMCWTECTISNQSNGFKITSAGLHKLPLSQIWEISHPSTPYFIQMAVKKLLNTFYVLILFAIHLTNHQ